MQNQNAIPPLTYQNGQNSKKRVTPNADDNVDCLTLLVGVSYTMTTLEKHLAVSSKADHGPAIPTEMHNTFTEGLV